MLRFFPPWQRFAVLGFELRTGAETWFIGQRRGGGDKSTKKRGFIQQVHQLADLTLFMGNLRFTPQMNLGD
ncbi:hypothetical protein Q5692_02935 [Microcoleus sp. C2C3]|uniref:hypothetical protein n=1 Tax=unclassified Microcoleus TaxID=2642155 RepID=UPI002FD008F0